MKEKLEDYLSGKVIPGDDYNYEQIVSWFEDEAQGYAGIVPEEHKENYDEYERLTDRYLYRYIRGNEYDSALIYGGGYGTEIIPIIKQIKEITILEPGDKFRRNEIAGKKVTYIAPQADGKMVFPDSSFDLITCFGVLHHVPNVSFILTEFNRVLKDGGVCLIREPIVSMHAFDGVVRARMTKRERGLPLTPFKHSILNAGFQIRREALHGFGPMTKLDNSIKFSQIGMTLDYMLCRMFRCNYTYNEYSFLRKFRPTEVSFVLEK